MGRPKKKEVEQEIEETDAPANSNAELSQEEKLQNLAAETLVGNVRDLFLDRIKHDKERKPWEQMTEDEQRSAIDTSITAAEDLIRKVVDIVASQGFVNAKAEIDSWKVKGRQVVISLKASATQENVLAFLGAGGGFVTMTFANDHAFDQDREPCKPDPNQAELPIDDADDGEDDFEGEEGDDE